MACGVCKGRVGSFPSFQSPKASPATPSAFCLHKLQKGGSRLENEKAAHKIMTSFQVTAALQKQELQKEARQAAAAAAALPVKGQS